MLRREVVACAEDSLSTLHPVLQAIYKARNVHARDQLDYSFKQLPSPDSMLGMDEMVDALCAALAEQQNIVIVADFDADGATSCAVAKIGLESLGFQHVDYVIPDRFKFGYGLTPEIVDVALQRKPEILITVDNGISSLDGVARARQQGLKVLITDHHLPGEELPDAHAIVNPNQTGCQFPSRNLAGVGVMFYVLLGLRKQLREKQWFEQHNIPEPNLAQLLDLVALGTVADVVPLDSINRTLVHHGLKRIQAGLARSGINALAAIAGRQLSSITSADLGFALAPRLNAAGRLQDMSVGVQCLLTDNPKLASELSAELNTLNNQRRVIEQDMKTDALEHLNQLKHLDTLDSKKAICLYHQNWHQGVIGILASRIKDSLHKPVIAFADSDNDELKGSGRSIPGLHLRDVLADISTRYPDLLLRFGGHAMAAGLSLQKRDLARFEKAFTQAVSKRLINADTVPVIYTDGQLDQDNLNCELAQLLENAGPWGQGFPEPVFEGVFEILNIRILKEKHVKLVLKMLGSDDCIDAIAFNTDNIDQWLGFHQVEIAYRLQVNRYRQQEKLQLMIEYLHAAKSRGTEQNLTTTCHTSTT
ncbi:MAG TPA: single-stranded-DNA-specific exonuclease RecJ [Crenotrichaceae bacterium]|nr:single-stranded-DNA-specific exonuclease RecJ [Crenotrichaceae bacterium]